MMFGRPIAVQISKGKEMMMLIVNNIGVVMAPCNSPMTKDVTTVESQRAAIYQQYFTSTAAQVDLDSFIPQINGYGTPVFSQLSSFAGI